MGKSYILISIRNSPKNCNRMRYQASDNLTFATCIDKTLIYTDEWWFTNNIEEAERILKGAPTYIGIKHQNGRIQKRTPNLPT